MHKASDRAVQALSNELGVSEDAALDGLRLLADLFHEDEDPLTAQALRKAATRHLAVPAEQPTLF